MYEWIHWTPPIDWLNCFLSIYLMLSQFFWDANLSGTGSLTVLIVLKLPDNHLITHWLALWLQREEACRYSHSSDSSSSCSKSSFLLKISCEDISKKFEEFFIQICPVRGSASVRKEERFRTKLKNILKEREREREMLNHAQNLQGYVCLFKNRWDLTKNVRSVF